MLSTRFRDRKNTRKFIDIVLEPEDIEVIYPTPRGKSIILQHRKYGQIIFLRRAFRQLVEKLGWSYEGARALLDDRVEFTRHFKLMLSHSRKKIYVGLVRGDDGQLYAYNATTEQFTPIPHAVLREYIEKLLRKKGMLYFYVEPVRFARRFGFLYYLFRLHSIGNIDIYAGIMVTNRNTATDAVHITPVIIYRKRDGTRSYEPLEGERAVAISHRGDIEDLLKRIGKAVEEAIKKLGEHIEGLKERIEYLSKRKISPREIDEFLERIEKEFSRKYSNWIRRVLRENIAEIGDNYLALMKTLADFISWTSRKPSVQEKFSRLSKKYMGRHKLSTRK